MLVNQAQSPLSNSQLLGKRKGCGSGLQPPRKYGNLFSHRQELASLMGEKIKWLDAQRKASLLIPPYNIDEWQIMSRFSSLYHKVVTTLTPPEQYEAQIALLEQIVQESIIIEWPKAIPGLGINDRTTSDDVSTEIDFAPLIHRARNVVKCRTPHPTMRVRVCALSDDDCGECPPIKEAFFRVTLVKLSGETSEYQVAGKLILTQREGTPATKSQDQNGAMMTADGRLIASQAAPDTHTYVLLEKYGELVKTTSFKFELGALCATFPEMGVTLNSMVDRRQLATRYAMQIDVAINIDNKIIVKHVVQSHPFLIAITNDQTEPLLTSIFWQRLLANEQLTDSAYLQPECSTKLEPSVPWKIVKEVLKNFVKAQYPPARSLCLDELLHIQSMLFLQRLVKCGDIVNELTMLEMELFGNIRDDLEFSGTRKIRYRLAREEVNDDVLVAKHEFMQEKCISLADNQTQLRHSLWQWLYRATEMIMDVGHKLCPSPVILEKKCSKTKRQMAAAEEYQTMLSLFNSRTVTFLSSKDVSKYFKLILEDDLKKKTFTKAIMIRFCDENAGHLSFAFTNSEDPSKPLMGSLSSEQIKDLKQGLPEFLFDESFPKQFDKIVRTEVDRSCANPTKFSAAVPKKKVIFNNYNTLRLQNDCIQTKDSETIRINPLSGERVAAFEFDTPPAFPQDIVPQPLEAAYLMALQMQHPIIFPFFKPNSDLESMKSNGASPDHSVDTSSNNEDEPKLNHPTDLVPATIKAENFNNLKLDRCPEKLPLPSHCLSFDEPLDLSPKRSLVEQDSIFPTPVDDEQPEFVFQAHLNHTSASS